MKIQLSLVFVIVTILILIIASIPSKEEYKAQQDIKYKNGPIVIEKNNAGCTKYQYYDSKFWKCYDQSIDYIEEKFCEYSITIKSDICRYEKVIVVK